MLDDSRASGHEQKLCRGTLRGVGRAPVEHQEQETVHTTVAAAASGYHCCLVTHLRFPLRRRSRKPANSIRGHVDVPSDPTVPRDLVRFEGWALHGNGVPARVDLVFNDTTSIPAAIGMHRPDVPAGLKEPDAAAACGWAVTVDLVPFTSGELRVHVVAVDDSGVHLTIASQVYELVDGHVEPRTDGPAAVSKRLLATPEWKWDLPDHLADTTAEVSREISSSERMPSEDIEGYLEVGRSALKAIRLTQIASGKADFGAILDMPSGHGRVLRWLKAAYPDAKLTACDLLPDGVDFCAEHLGATPVYSSPWPTADAFSDRYDLIFVGSLLTHVDVPLWDHLITLWHDLLTPDGLLVVTTHGELVAERMRAGHLYGYPAPAVTRALRAYEHAGFTFLEEPPANIEYGITLARPEWTLSRLLRHPDFRVVMSGEALWDRHQDVTAVVKRPLTLG
jgi:SAM-dependent methyltransferase